MKMIQRFCFLLLVLCAQKSVAQQKVVVKAKMVTVSERRNEIAYQAGRKLQLSDFQGDEEPNVDAVAMAYTGVSLRYAGAMKNGVVTLEIKVYASFDKARSWCLPSSRNGWTLAHEQRHFDITALNACALLREVQLYHFTKNFEQEIDALQRKYKQKNEEEQDIYDSETNHGIGREVQLEWNEKIKKTIAESSDCFGQS